MKETLVKYKPQINKMVMWSIRNHWLFLVTMLVVQYTTGKIVSGDWIIVGMNLSSVFEIHQINGLLLVSGGVMLTLEKLWLWLLRKGKI
jgi:hypothetical protein